MTKKLFHGAALAAAVLAAACSESAVAASATVYRVGVSGTS